MTDQTILPELAQLIHSNKCPLDNINDMTSIEELQIDSLSLSSVLLDIENHFNIIIPDEEWAKWETVGDIIDHIDEYKREYSSIRLPEIDDVTPKDVDSSEGSSFTRPPPKE